MFLSLIITYFNIRLTFIIVYSVIILIITNQVTKRIQMSDKVDFELEGGAFEFHQLAQEAKQRAYKDFIDK